MTMAKKNDLVSHSLSLPPTLAMLRAFHETWKPELDKLEVQGKNKSRHDKKAPQSNPTSHIKSKYEISFTIPRAEMKTIKEEQLLQ